MNLHKMLEFQPLNSFQETTPNEALETDPRSTSPIEYEVRRHSNTRVPRTRSHKLQEDASSHPTIHAHQTCNQLVKPDMFPQEHGSLNTDCDNLTGMPHVTIFRTQSPSARLLARQVRGTIGWKSRANNGADLDWTDHSAENHVVSANFAGFFTRDGVWKG